MSLSLVPARVDRVVEVHASQYREDVSLEEGDEELETGQGDGHDERKNGTADAERAKAPSEATKPANTLSVM